MGTTSTEDSCEKYSILVFYVIGVAENTKKNEGFTSKDFTEVAANLHEITE